ncbi:DUF3426 domain-containing protein [Microbulbifer sp. SAOS-129_SWC]|uniref:DUF3426 domain-containing protein n=1 Tax=Microbulbifer sp. SAOS-129_SWC TaxID=3145235 RepID=UPI0032173F0B
MSQLVTRCPHCSTSFHVNEQQLRAARGAVRCGSCLQVFRADENIVFTDSDPAAERDLEALLEDDDFLIHDDIELEGEEDNERPAPPTMAVDTDDDIAINDSSDDEPLIGEAFGDNQWQEIAQAPEVTAGDAEDSAGDDSEDDEHDDSAALTPAWDDQDLWAGEQPEPPPQREPALSADWDDDAVTASVDDPIVPERGHTPPPVEPTGERHASATPSREQLLSSIEPAPLEVSWQPRRDRRLPGWLWALLALLLAAALAAQVAYFRFDTLSKRQPWRSLYARVCPLLHCRLPEMVDLQAIHTANLVVRSHPKVAGALVVDAVLLNTAAYPQPFPTLQLEFSDLKNQPVASRRFTPREYLRGELAGRKLMPSGNPVHIAIEIADPGSDAVNYELHIVR